MGSSTNFLGILKESIIQSAKNRIPTLSAALSFYLLFSAGPLMLILLNLMGYIFNLENPENELFGFLQNYMMSSGAEVFQSVGQNYELLSGNLFITIAGLVLLFLAATKVFNHVQYSMNSIWGVKSETGLKRIIRKRLLSFGMILSIGFVIFGSIFVQGMLLRFTEYISLYLLFDKYLFPVASSLLFIVITGVSISLLFKILPDADVPMKSAFLGGFLTAFLFFIGQIGATYYFRLSGVASTYGAAGSLLVFLLWIYFSSQIFFFGVQFTAVFTKKRTLD